MKSVLDSKAFNGINFLPLTGRKANPQYEHMTVEAILDYARHHHAMSVVGPIEVSSACAAIAAELARDLHGRNPDLQIVILESVIELSDGNVTMIRFCFEEKETPIDAARSLLHTVYCNAA